MVMEGRNIISPDMNRGHLIAVLCIALLSCALRCEGQVPPRDRWGEKFNSPGATLTYKEIGRTTMLGKTVITYNLFAAGLPKGEHYTLCTMNIGTDPGARADAYLNETGKVVNVLADPEHHVAEDPINLKVAAAKGEPLQFALVSDDRQLQAFTQIIPFPIEKDAGSGHLTAIETAPYYVAMFIGIRGLQPNEEFEVNKSSENEGARSTAKADSQGRYNVGLFPVVKGKKRGTARFLVKAKSCNIGIEFPWGEGTQEYQ